jgi:sorting nexin-8
MKDDEVSSFSRTETRWDRADITADLPKPNLPGLATSTALPGISELAAKPSQRPATPPPAPKVSSPPKQRTMRKQSLDFPEADPWGSPALHKGHNHEPEPPKTNGTSRDLSNGVHEPVRTTSTFTTKSTQGSNGPSSQGTEETSSATTSGVWGSYDGNTSATFTTSTDPTIPGDGFGGGGGGGGGGEQPAPNIPSRAFGGGRVTSGGVEEVVTILLLPEKEGVFMFQHHNYQVSSVRRASKVVRRYSDFVWLLDCLHKRYPFRQLPLLPPKRVGGMLLFLTAISCHG